MVMSFLHIHESSWKVLEEISQELCKCGEDSSNLKSFVEGSRRNLGGVQLLIDELLQCFLVIPKLKGCRRSEVLWRYALPPSSRRWSNTGKLEETFLGRMQLRKMF